MIHILRICRRIPPPSPEFHCATLCDCAMHLAQWSNFEIACSWMVWETLPRTAVRMELAIQLRKRKSQGRMDKEWQITRIWIPRFRSHTHPHTHIHKYIFSYIYNIYIIYYLYIIDPFKYICPKCLSIKLWVAICHVPKMSRLLGLVCEHLAWSGMPSRPWHAMTGTPFKDEMNGGRNDYLNCRTKGVLIFKNRWVMFEHGMLFLTAFMDS